MKTEGNGVEGKRMMKNAEEDEEEEGNRMKGKMRMGRKGKY